MTERLVSAHNPIYGPRHLGHYASTLMEWPSLQKRYECVFVIDDLIAYFLYPVEQEKILARTLYTARDFLASGINSKRCAIVATSMIPELLELITFLSTAVDVEYCRRLYQHSFCGLLKPYHRKQLGLGKYESVAEFVYPQLALPSLTLGVRASAFQGGEEITGYVDILEELAKGFNSTYGKTFVAPRLVTPRIPYLVGVDGRHMVTGNDIVLSSPPEDIRAAVNRIADSHVFSDLCNCLGDSKIARQISAGNVSLQEQRSMMADFLIHALEPYRNFKITNGEIVGVLKDGAKMVRAMMRETISDVKKLLGIPSLD